MANRKARIAGMLLVLLTTVWSVTFATAGQQQKVTLRVDGLACPFCAYGLEKKLKRIEGVEKLEIKINQGLVLLYFKEGARIDKDVITKKVKEAGFTPRRITVEKPVAKSTSKAQKVSLNIEGMKCQGCVSGVQTALTKIQCVKEVSVDLQEKTATVLCAGDKKDKEKLVAAVNALGFKARLLEPKAK